MFLSTSISIFVFVRGLLCSLHNALCDLGIGIRLFWIKIGHKFVRCSNFPSVNFTSFLNNRPPILDVIFWPPFENRELEINSATQITWKIAPHMTNRLDGCFGIGFWPILAVIFYKYRFLALCVNNQVWWQQKSILRTKLSLEQVSKVWHSPPPMHAIPE